jgi:hypothetical protein
MRCLLPPTADVPCTRPGQLWPTAEMHDRDQDAETVLAALRMTSRTTPGFDSMGTWDDATSVVAAFIRFESAPGLPERPCSLPVGEGARPTLTCP